MYIQILINLCVHSHVDVLVTDPVVWIGRHECVGFAFGIDGGHVLSVLILNDYS